MSEASRVFSDLFITPEHTFPIFDSKFKAYFFIYILPFIIFFFLMASALYYSYMFLVVITAVIFGALYLGVIWYSYQDYRSPQKLKLASEILIPEILVNYFRKLYPSATVPMMVSDDKKQWVAYGHINKDRMARAITFADYHMMTSPPDPELDEFFMNHSHEVKHQYLIIEDPIQGKFRITNSPVDGSVFYPVTVFDLEEINDTPQ